MPIKFRCAYCNQLMGIAKRKAGTVVRCPTCAGQLVVPNPDEEASSQPEPPGDELLFERPDFDALFGNAAAEGGAPAKPASPAAAPVPAFASAPSPPARSGRPTSGSGCGRPCPALHRATPGIGGLAQVGHPRLAWRSSSGWPSPSRPAFWSVFSCGPLLGKRRAIMAGRG